MYSIQIEDMDLHQIARSGQCFRMEAIIGEGAIWKISSSKDYVEAVKTSRGFLFSCEETEFKETWSHYFDLETDYGSFKKSVDPEDEYLQEAMKAGWGVRILNQELWEMLVTFLISQNNNISRITKSVSVLCSKFGERRLGKGLLPDGKGGFLEVEREYFTFPEPERILEAGLTGLGQFSLGYRDKYIVKLAERLSGEEGEKWLLSLKEADYEQAHALLMEQYGIGKKVADCVCLFGLHHIGAFPMDTHVKQIIKAHYPGGFPFKRYEGYAGVLQQYMFYYKVNRLKA